MWRVLAPLAGRLRADPVRSGCNNTLQCKAGRIPQTAHGIDASSSASALFGNDVIRVFGNGRMVTWLPMSLTGVAFGVAVLLVFLGASSLFGIAVMCSHADEREVGAVD